MDEVLDKPARVGAVVFGKGVSWRVVIECAQRAYEFHERELAKPVDRDPTALAEIMGAAKRAGLKVRQP